MYGHRLMSAKIDLSQQPTLIASIATPEQADTED